MAGGKLPCGITEHRVGRWSEMAPADHWKSVGERARRKVKGQKDTREWEGKLSGWRHGVNFYCCDSSSRICLVSLALCCRSVHCGPIYVSASPLLRTLCGSFKRTRNSAGEKVVGQPEELMFCIYWSIFHKQCPGSGMLTPTLHGHATPRAPLPECSLMTPTQLPQVYTPCFSGQSSSPHLVSLDIIQELHTCLFWEISSWHKTSFPWG